MSDSNTIRVLSFDGGGERGYMSLQFLKRFIQLWGIDPATLAQKFDVISGASVGGIIGLATAFGKTPDEIIPFFTVQGPYIFSLSSLIPSWRPGKALKIALVLADIPFYQSSGPTADSYGSGLLRATIDNVFGTNTMQELKTSVVIPSYQQDTKSYVLFSNVSYPDFIGEDELIANVAMATSAAPAYLPYVTLNGHIYIDGGIYANNCASFGRTLATIQKPAATRCCVLSIGTGIGDMGFSDGNPEVTDPRVTPPVGPFNTVETIFELYPISSVGGQESIAKNMFLESSYAMNRFYFYRFQPPLDPNMNTELDNTDPEILEYYENAAIEWFNDDIENIATFLAHLTI